VARCCWLSALIVSEAIDLHILQLELKSNISRKSRRIWAGASGSIGEGWHMVMMMMSSWDMMLRFISYSTVREIGVCLFFVDTTTRSMRSSRSSIVILEIGTQWPPRDIHTLIPKYLVVEDRQMGQLMFYVDSTCRTWYQLSSYWIKELGSVRKGHFGARLPYKSLNYSWSLTTPTHSRNMHSIKWNELCWIYGLDSAGGSNSRIKEVDCWKNSNSFGIKRKEIWVE
jgi:hypothetical protein